jgi:hypothetical protein
MDCQIATNMTKEMHQAVINHGILSDEYRAAIDKIISHKKTCLACISELQQPRVIKLFEVRIDA